MRAKRSEQGAQIINLSRAMRDKSYRWQDRDPDLEEICNMITDSGLTTWGISKRISRETGGAFSVSPTTMNKWLEGKVRRPQNFTLSWVAFALGYERKWVKF